MYVKYTYLLVHTTSLHQMPGGRTAVVWGWISHKLVRPSPRDMTNEWYTLAITYISVVAGELIEPTERL